MAQKIGPPLGVTAQPRPARPEKIFAGGGNLPATRTSCGMKGRDPAPRTRVGRTTVPHLKRAVVIAATTGAIAAAAVPAWAAAGPSAAPSAAPTSVTGSAPRATPVPSAPVTRAPANAGPSTVPAPRTSGAPTAAPEPAGTGDPSATPAPAAPGAPRPSATPELAHTGGSDSTNAALGALAVGLVGLGAGTLFVVRRRALR